jgi:acyl-CoA reductase-like NAD-dependent aldehyde dehydrogenase
MSTERVIVLRPALEPLVAAIKQHISTLSVGDPDQALRRSFQSAARTTSFAMLKEAKEAGAKPLLVDMDKAGPALLKSHILLGVKLKTRLWQCESFGPVLVLVAVDTIHEAVELANASDYSLVASVWTKDVYSAMDVAMRIRARAWFCLRTWCSIATAHAGLNRFDEQRWLDNSRRRRTRGLVG